jgi:hypothetical protein
MLGLTETQEALIRTSKSHATALQIMAFAQRQEGATAEEFREHLDLNIGTFNARLYDLVQTGCIAVIGKRKTSSGRLARVYRTVEGVTFVQYLELVSALPRNRKTRDTLTATEAAVLQAGMRLLKAWRTTKTDKRRKRALLTFVEELPKLMKLDAIHNTKKEQSNDG